MGNHWYAQLLNEQLGNRFHGCVNHSDIVTRTPLIELRSLAEYYSHTPYIDALNAATAANNEEAIRDRLGDFYYHLGVRFRIDAQGHFIQQHRTDQRPVFACQDRLDLFHFFYSIKETIRALFN